MTTKDSERGFTLLEMLMASVLGGLLIIASFGMLYDSIGIADVLRSRAQLNAAARESFDLLLDGGVSNNVNIYGLRGRSAEPSQALSDIGDVRPAYRVQLQDDITTPPTVALSGSTAVTHNVACTAINDPLPACILGN
ncbi:MAG: prepilin-type N-terminal cleavage/methylation domain-containing protein, partial [Rhodospirillales bacterium]|nr:prepilin-type N-terminal cleavage/methylation domain-containing protein [Rhodospirillales bacterium]